MKCDVCGKEINIYEKYAGKYGSVNPAYHLCGKCGRIWIEKYFIPSGIVKKYYGMEFFKAWYRLFAKFIRNERKKVRKKQKVRLILT